MSLPSMLVERIHEIHSAEDAERVIDYCRAPERIGFRLNTLRGGVLELDIPNEPIEGLADAYSVMVDDREALTHSSAANQGQIYVQNPSSLLPVLALAVAPGQEVLDLAAAPGGKAIHIAGCMNNQGRLAVVEAIRPRFFRLRENLRRCGVEIAQAYLMDGRAVERKTPGRFERVLLDAPCSSEARIRVDVEASFQHWNERKIHECARKQKGLLRAAFVALKPGGRMVYSTCSFAPEENEAVVHELLVNFPDQARICSWVPPACDWRPGLVEFRNRRYATAVAQAVRVLPDGLFDGFFFCVIEKLG